MTTWREHCRPIIAKVIAEVGTDDIKKLRKALREAYPYYRELCWPYKVWCDEINVQFGKKKMGKPGRKPKIYVDDPNQLKLCE